PKFSDHPGNDDQHDDEDDERKNTGKSSAAVPFRHSFSGSFVLAPDGLADQVDPGGKTSFIIASPEQGLDMAFRDLVCRLLLEQKKISKMSGFSGLTINASTRCILCVFAPFRIRRILVAYM